MLVSRQIGSYFAELINNRFKCDGLPIHKPLDGPYIGFPQQEGLSGFCWRSGTIGIIRTCFQGRRGK